MMIDDSDIVGRVAVLGDVGGHLPCLLTALTRLDVDPSRLVLPDGLAVVQVGDLIGGRADDAAVLRLVDDLMQANGRRWVQLAGNWEGRHLGGAPFSSRRPERPLDGDSVSLLEAWLDEGRLNMAVAIDTSRGPVVAIHAGITRGYWRDELGTETSAARVAAVLNDGLRRLPGVVLGRGGPAWAWSTTELYPSWLSGNDPPPFGQIHGHSSPYNFGAHRLRLDCSREVEERLHLDVRRRRCWLDIGSRRFVAVDPGLDSRSRGTELWPLILSGHVVPQRSEAPMRCAPESR